MRQSTGAILAWGYYWDDEHPTPDLWEAADKIGLEFAHHCCDDLPIPYLVDYGTTQYASRGFPQPIYDIEPTATKEQLDAFIKEHSLPPPANKEPCWFICSWWG